jgi:glycosyltransferase involved in cell wall biosynthesis
MGTPPIVLFIPLEEQLEGTVHRGSNLIAMLWQKYSVVGVPRPRNFGGGNLALRLLRVFGHWVQVFVFAWQHRESIDLVFTENAHAAFGGPLARVIGVPCVWDIETDPFLYAAAFEKSWPFKWLARVIHGISRRFTDVLLVPCEEDRQGYIDRGHRPERVIVVPLCVDLARLPVDKEGRGTVRQQLRLKDGKAALIYTGQRTEAPYREGAAWICGELALALESRCPGDFRVLMTGRGPELPSPSAAVTFTGFVPDIYDYIAAADVCLAPIWRDTGMPGKVVEYLALGKPAVLTSLVRGFPHLRNGENAMIAATREEFVDKVAYLINHPHEAKRIGANARRTAEEHYSHGVVAPQLWRVIDHLREERTLRRTEWRR